MHSKSYLKSYDALNSFSGSDENQLGCKRFSARTRYKYQLIITWEIQSRSLDSKSLFVQVQVQVPQTIDPHLGLIGEIAIISDRKASKDRCTSLHKTKESQLGSSKYCTAYWDRIEGLRKCLVLKKWFFGFIKLHFKKFAFRPPSLTRTKQKVNMWDKISKNETIYRHSNIFSTEFHSRPTNAKVWRTVTWERARAVPSSKQSSRPRPPKKLLNCGYLFSLHCSSLLPQLRLPFFRLFVTVRKSRLLHVFMASREELLTPFSRSQTKKLARLERYE